MAENDAEADLPSRSAASSVDIISATHPKPSARENDAALLSLQKRFNALTAELNADVERLHAEVGSGALTKRVEAILARLDPIERAIMETPACTLAGLGVKARHAAYVLSQYWDAPIDRIDWDARAVRLLIEAVCQVAHVPLPFRNLSDGE
jgi:hypothetical protein